MSGSGDSSGGGGTFTPDTIDCANLFINTQLSSPKPDVVSKLHGGAELTIALEDHPGVRVAMVYFNGELAGGLASPETARLRRCMEQGMQYGATVIDVTGGQVRVRVHPA